MAAFPWLFDWNKCSTRYTADKPQTVCSPPSFILIKVLGFYSRWHVAQHCSVCPEASVNLIRPLCCKNTPLIRRASVRVSVTETTRADSSASSRGRRRGMFRPSRQSHASEGDGRDRWKSASMCSWKMRRRQSLQNNSVIDRGSAGNKGPVLWVLIKDPRRRQRNGEG